MNRTELTKPFMMVSIKKKSRLSFSSVLLADQITVIGNDMRV